MVSTGEERSKLVLRADTNLSAVANPAKASKDNKTVIHQKKRRLSALQSRRAALKDDIQRGKVRICFGSKKLFRKQFDLAANGYKNHDEWVQDWKSERSKSFFLIGSKDETSGNQSATAFFQEDGRLSLRLRIPDALSKFGKYLVINDLHFAYGHEQVVAALHQCLARKTDGESGVAISYRFVRDKKGWQIFVSIPIQRPTVVTRKGVGVIGVDINADHLAVVETDRFGNPICHTRFNLSTYGKTKDQAKALIGDVVKDIVELGAQTKKPLVIEKLSFEKKKSELREIGNSRYSRMLSSLAYGAIISGIKSRAFRFGVEVNEVNPAYTSIIGRVKFAKRYGVSIHESAALCIGRRCLGGSERMPRRLLEIADGKGGYATSPVPVRNRGEHAWASWRRLRRKLPAVLAAHFRARKSDP